MEIAKNICAGIGACVIVVWVFLLLLTLYKHIPFSIWERGTCHGRVARRHRLNGQVHFILWKAGQTQGDYTYPYDFWFPFHEDHWSEFIPEKKHVKTISEDKKDGR